MSEIKICVIGFYGKSLKSACFVGLIILCFFFSSRRRHTRFDCDWSSDVCSSDLHYMLNSIVVAYGGHTGDDDAVEHVVPDDGERRAVVLKVEGRGGRPEVQRELEIGRASCRERV